MYFLSLGSEPSKTLFRKIVFLQRAAASAMLCNPRVIATYAQYAGWNADHLAGLNRGILDLQPVAIDNSLGPKQEDAY